MSSTAQAIIFAAFRLSGEWDSGSNPTTQQQTDALEALNDMMSGFEAEGIALGWTPMAAVANTVTTPDWALEGIKANLLKRIAPQYGLPVPAVIAELARLGLERMRANGLQPPEAEMDHLPQRTLIYNIKTG